MFSLYDRCCYCLERIPKTFFVYTVFGVILPAESHSRGDVLLNYLVG